MQTAAGPYYSLTKMLGKVFTSFIRIPLFLHTNSLVQFLRLQQFTARRIQELGFLFVLQSHFSFKSVHAPSLITFQYFMRDGYLLVRVEDYSTSPKLVNLQIPGYSHAKLMVL